MRGTWLGFAFAALVTGTIAVTTTACSNDANDVAACQQLEFARCARAQSCGIDIEAFPLHAGSSAADAVTACQLFYEDACLHGLVTSVAPPSSKAVEACANAIATTTDCNVVINPQSSPMCSWLNPPDAGPDATDASVPDVNVPEVEVVYVYPDATVVVDANEGVDAGACYEGCDNTCAGDTVCIQNCEETMCGGS